MLCHLHPDSEKIGLLLLWDNIIIDEEIKNFNNKYINEFLLNPVNAKIKWRKMFGIIDVPAYLLTLIVL